jgi:TRAP-type C4-dicarboxylate transport system permease small subunit
VSRRTRATLAFLVLFENLVLALLLLFIVVVVILQVVSRYAGQPIGWTEELSRYAVILVTFLGGAAAVRTREHVAFDLLLDRLSAHTRARAALNGIIVAITIAFMTVLLLTGVQWVLSIRDLGLRAVTVNIPTYLIGIVVPLCGLLSILYSLALLRRPSEPTSPRSGSL